MGGDEKGIESPIELLRQLIEESGKWTEEMVMMARQVIVMFAIIIYLSVLCFWQVFYNPVMTFISGEGDLPFPAVIVLLVWFASFVFLVSIGFRVYRRYRKRIARRDRWREKFEVLNKKEEEIERLLSEGAG